MWPLTIGRGDWFQLAISAHRNFVGWWHFVQLAETLGCDHVVMGTPDIMAQSSKITSASTDLLAHLGIATCGQTMQRPMPLDPTCRQQWRRWLASPIGRPALERRAR